MKASAPLDLSDPNVCKMHFKGGTNAEVKFHHFLFAVSFLCAGAGRSDAQTFGYADAISQLATSCSKDIEKFCKKTNLGGGRMR